MKKFVICSLLAGVIVLINSCRKKEPAITFISSKVFTNFPSASAIEYYNNRLYVFGDDAPWLLVLDTNYTMVDSVRYIQHFHTRISKGNKPDIEAATLLHYGEVTALYAFGSQSTPARKMVYTFPTNSLHGFTGFTYTLRNSKVKEWNIEGAAFVQDQLVLANRANTTHKTNYLLLATFDPAGNKENKTRVLELTLPTQPIVAGVSGLFYIPENDVLLFTASEEGTSNAFDDGTIGESYLGTISNFSKKMYRKKVAPNEFLKLADVSPEFSKQKIESVCMQETEDNHLLLHLVADNDNGQSKLFKIKLKL